ncbi:MAG: cytochrome c [Gemmatimonadota bacterium]
MKRTFRWVAGPIVLLTAVACAPQTGAMGTPEAPAPSDAPPPAAAAGPVSVYSGVYTAAQADRGDAVQRRECSSCHSSNDWSAGRLLSSWNGRTAFDLVSHIRNTMPMDSPGRLSMDEYTDIVAFIFDLNDIPAGDSELEANEEALTQVEIEYRR